MKKILLSIAATFTVFIMAPAIAMAAPVQTVIGGTITNGNSPVNGATVTVTCDTNSQTTTSSNDGQYAVVYQPASLCPAGTQATVVATLGSGGGSNNGTVTTSGGVINVAIINVSLPELGVITGISAAVLGAGAFLVIRNRQLAKK